MTDQSPLKYLLPYLIITAVAAVGVALVLVRFLPGAAVAAAPPAIVTFDVLKFGNAQRAVAATFLGKAAESADAGTLLLEVSRRTQEAIARAAGPDAVVLVRQGVVQGELRDITDDVLRDLGLPTNVPAPTPLGYLLNEAPTYLSLGVLGQLKRSQTGPRAGGNDKALP